MNGFSWNLTTTPQEAMARVEAAVRDNDDWVLSSRGHRLQVWVPYGRRMRLRLVAGSITATKEGCFVDFERGSLAVQYLIKTFFACLFLGILAAEDAFTALPIGLLAFVVSLMILGAWRSWRRQEEVLQRLADVLADARRLPPAGPFR